MIEAITAYIQDKGYTVLVSPGILTIAKNVPDQSGDRWFSILWAISQIELAQARKEVLLFAADRRMEEINAEVARVSSYYDLSIH